MGNTLPAQPLTTYTGSEYFNYKGFFSVILLEVVSSEYKFTLVDVSGKGASSDAHIYNECDLPDGLQNNDILGFPQLDPLQGNTEDVPYFLVGDDAFGLTSYMMKPYGNKDLTRK